jgi:predicted nuclease with TOPRIM domain
MAEISMETYLRNLKPTNRSYTIPDDNFTELLRRYTNMKKQIAECVEIKRQYDILNADIKHVESQHVVIFQLKEKLKSVQQENAQLKQENAQLEQENHRAITLAKRTLEELKLARANK